jgi:1,4-dihydroxy-2-naphthoate polyprenyltransferase
MRIWLQAARPKTIPASIVPVILASALAYHDGHFSLYYTVICLLFSIFVQVGTNFANDYFDYIKGADTVERLGPLRAVSSGLINANDMRNATAIVLSFAFFIGTLLVFRGGYWLLIIGALSIISAVAYTGGPFPLAYNALGDIFVFIFFGIIAVVFTYYVQAIEFSFDSLIVGSACGFVATNILVVNNCRDSIQDAQAGKITSTVRFGRTFSFRQHFISYMVALIAPVILFFTGYKAYVLFPLLLLPQALSLNIQLRKSVGRQHNAILGKSALFMILYGLLLSAGIILS